MKGLRRILAFLRDPAGVLGGFIATVRARLAPLERRIPRRPIHGATGTAVFTLLSGCSSAPSRSILGSYFPSWMICVLVAMCLTIVVRAVLAKVGIEEALPAPIVVYLAFTLAFSFALWLLWLG